MKNKNNFRLSLENAIVESNYLDVFPDTQYNDYIDKIAYFTVKADGNMPMPDEQEPTYTMVTFGNMSYIVGGVIQSSTPAQVHMLVGNYCQSGVYLPGGRVGRAFGSPGRSRL